jgi:betaine reductase
MRGNDLLAGAPDVMVTDSLTGNVLMKVFSAYTSGGDYESLGYGYGPGIGEGYGRVIMILSRASGAPVVAGAIRYAADLVRGNLADVAKAEFAAANAAGLKQIIEEAREATAPKAAAQSEVAPPPAKITNHEIGGVDILQIEDAVKALWKAGVYAGSGMGCTGPVIMVAHEDTDAAIKALKENGYL